MHSWALARQLALIADGQEALPRRRRWSVGSVNVRPPSTAPPHARLMGLTRAHTTSRAVPRPGRLKAEVDRQTASPALRLLDELMSILDPGQGKIEWWGVVG